LAVTQVLPSLLASIINKTIYYVKKNINLHLCKYGNKQYLFSRIICPAYTVNKSTREDGREISSYAIVHEILKQTQRVSKAQKRPQYKSKLATLVKYT
jgi:hypothetical protein